MYSAIQSQQNHKHHGSHMISTSGRALPLKSTRVSAVAHGGIARVALLQVFENPYDEVLSVTYSLPLPADGAVSGFAFLLQDRRVVGEVDRKARARERYQRALSEGRSAALLAQERSSLFTQEVGNIPPRAEITVEVSVDQRLLWLPEGAWEWRFPTVVAPRYLGAETRDPERVSPVISQEPLAASLSFSLLVEDALSAAPSSSSHALMVQASGRGTLISLEDSGARRDQDLVVRWGVSTAQVGASLNTCRPMIGGLDHLSFGLLTLVPPAHKTQRVARDLILLLDVSGSMYGAPIHQLKEVSRALIATLSDQDQLEIVVFANSAKRWKKAPVLATEAVKEEALAYITSLQSSGGTEMKAGILKALAPLRRDSQRQVILMTDGHIGDEEAIIKEIYARLPLGSRVHTLGIGSAVNRSLTAPVARAGDGVEQIVGLSERAERAAARLVARTDAPLVVGLSLGGSALLEACPSRLPDLYAGSPALLSLKLRPEGGELTIEGYTAAGPWRQLIQVPPMSPAQGDQAIAALYAREAVEDLEMALAAGRPRREVDQEIEDLGVAFQIATRLTSWVAISQEATVEAEAPARHEVMPQELPAGMSAAALGLRPVLVASAGEAQRSQSVRTREASKDLTSLDSKRKVSEEVLELAEAEESDAPTLLARFDSMPLDEERSAPEKPAPPRAPMMPTRRRASKPLAAGSQPPAPPASGEAEDKRVIRSGRGAQALTVASWKATIKERSDSALVLEFVLPEAFDWRPTSFTLFFAGGSVALPLEAKRSTPAGRFAAGSTIKLTLVLSGRAVTGPLASLLVLVGGARYHLTLS